MNIKFRIALFVLIPIVLLPLLLVHNDPRLKCVYILVIMASFWFLDILPYGVTSILPVLLAPLLELDSSANISVQYASDSLLLCLGRLIMACAFQQQNVHRRFGLFLIKKLGPQPRWLILSCMIPSYVLTMFISNTATAPIMLEFAIEMVEIIKKIEEGIEVSENFFPTVDIDERTPIIQKNLRKHSETSQPHWENEYTSMVSVMSNKRGSMERSIPYVEPDNEVLITNPNKLNIPRFCKALYISTGYAASSGAVATIVACGPNLVLYELVQRAYGSSSGLNYGTFIALGLPTSIVTLLLTWFWVGIVHLGPKVFLRRRKNTPNEDLFYEKVEELKEEMGPISFPELSCIGLTGVVIILWITRQFGVSGGWGHAFNINGKMSVTDATPMILVIALFYIWPSRPNFWSNRDGEKPGAERLLTWDSTHKNLPWSIIFLLGAGFAISHICEVSGLSLWISEELQKGLSNLSSPYGIMFLASMLSIVSTEFLSSTSALPIYIKIFISLAQLRNENPFLYLFPLAFSASFSFCLPAATTPNIAIFNRGLASSFDLLKTGIFMDIVFMVVSFLFTIALVPSVFNTLNPTHNVTDIYLP